MADTDYTIEDILEAKRRDGSLLREKARVLAEVGLDKIYPRLVDPDIPTSALMEIMKYLSELGDMKPKANAQPAQQGPGFSITINIPQSDGNPPITIEGRATTTVDEDGEEHTALEIPDMEPDLPELPTFNTLDFQFNHDLSAGVGAFDDGEML